MENLVLPTSQVTLDLAKVQKEQTFALMDAVTVYHYEKNVRTDTVEGTKYTVANVRTFDKFDVKTPETTPAVTREQIAESEERIFISFANAVAKPVKIEFGKLSLSVTADSAKIVRKTN